MKAPDVLKDIGGLETNRINQLVVKQTLQTTRDPNIFAMGDCAACPLDDTGATVPPRAQAAHQEASHLLKQIPRYMKGEPLEALSLSRFRARSYRSAATARSAI